MAQNANIQTKEARVPKTRASFADALNAAFAIAAKRAAASEKDGRRRPFRLDMMKWKQESEEEANAAV